jgi:phytoene synthase
MPRDDAPRPDDVAACRAILRKGSRSFAAAASLLPARVRDAATVLYAFCRVADDEVDEAPGSPAAALERLRERLDGVYAGAPRDEPVDRALAAVVGGDHVPRALLDALLDGMAWDVEARRYETFDELLAYAARVAGTVGAMMSVVMGRRSPDVIARACDLGVAMQLTNIARDVGEDARRGRLYLPLRWMRDAGVDPDAWLARPTHDAAIASLVSRLLAAAEALYRRADAGIASLPADCRVAIGAARFIYADIGRVIARAEFDAIGQRAVVGRWRKVWLVGRALFARWRSDPARIDPPLEPVRFLVAACGEPR